MVEYNPFDIERTKLSDPSIVDELVKQRVEKPPVANDRLLSELKDCGNKDCDSCRFSCIDIAKAQRDLTAKAVNEDWVKWFSSLLEIWLHYDISPLLKASMIAQLNERKKECGL